MVTYTDEMGICGKERARKKRREADLDMKAVLFFRRGEQFGKAERPMRPVIDKVYYFKCHRQENQAWRISLHDCLFTYCKLVL